MSAVGVGDVFGVQFIGELFRTPDSDPALR
jgi:hypothetical protein